MSIINTYEKLESERKSFYSKYIYFEINKNLRVSFDNGLIRIHGFDTASVSLSPEDAYALATHLLKITEEKNADGHN